MALFLNARDYQDLIRILATVRQHTVCCPITSDRKRDHHAVLFAYSINSQQYIDINFFLFTRVVLGNSFAKLLGGCCRRYNVVVSPDVAFEDNA